MFTPTRLFIALGFLAITTQAHAACEVKKLDGHSLSRCKVWPAFPDKAISAKSTFVPDSEGDQDGVFDLELSLLNASDAKPLATYAKPGAYNSDATRFDDLKIDTARYRLASDVRAFGLRSDFSIHLSSANPYSRTDLALYVREGAKLRPVLEGLVIRKVFGEGSGDCENKDTQIRRTVEIGPSSHNGFADLIVSSSGSVSSSTQSGKECVSKTTDLKNTQITLIYDGKQYTIPEDLRGY
ncbi:hypothetical protein PGC34_06850 [Pseudomonas kribbensis]|uniref:hypothetical protein n=1 Tax=Pseudomonas kribbensis TaxID=1628086 RepID=UPI002739A825|nr:hypothetical protein [Pseudomonas sp. A29(2023)]MDL5595725.1 hypothetical protein [Bacillus subtilis]